MALSEKMVKNKDFVLTLDLYQKWDKTTLTAHLISASCVKIFGDRNSLMLFVHRRDMLVSEFSNDLSTCTISTDELEAAEVFAKKIDC